MSASDTTMLCVSGDHQTCPGVVGNEPMCPCSCSCHRTPAETRLDADVTRGLYEVDLMASSTQTEDSVTPGHAD